MYQQLLSIHFFSVEGVSLLYDPYTGLILKLSPEEATAIKKFLSSNDLSLLNEYERGVIEKVLHAIEEERNKKGIKECKFKRLERSELKVKSLTMVISQTCNMSCKYCYAHEGRFNYNIAPDLMSYQVAEKAIELFLPLELESVIFYGGEPLLNFSLIKKIVRMYQDDLQFSIVTNGTLISREKAKFFAEHNVHVTVSLDGPQHIHDSTRVYKSGKGSHRDVLRGIRLLKEYGVPFTIETTFSKTYSSEIDLRSLIEYLLQFTDTLVITPVLPIGKAKGSCYALDGKTFLQIMKSLVDIFLEDPWRVKEQSIIYHIHNIVNPPPLKTLFCDKLKEQVAVFANGDVYPCYNAAYNLFKVGNVRFTSLDKIQENRYHTLSKYFSIENLEPRWYYNITDICVHYVMPEGINLEKSFRDARHRRKLIPLFDREISEFLEYLIYRLVIRFGAEEELCL